MANKKTVRLTESEMVTLIENIVNQVKSEKKRKINESRKPNLLRERQYRLLMESANAELEADLESVEGDPEKEEKLLDKIENFIEQKKCDIKSFSRKMKMKIKRLFRKSKRKGRKNLSILCPKW
tara:strand:+ start:7196 stop:7567 length:372 start_codon:yes stop_codon:yes gene_type:complete